MAIPNLQPVLYYTPSDPYSVDIDNRPLYNLSSNISNLATAMVGSGYGEHIAVAGGLLTPGKAVRLLDNGMIKYPDSADSISTDAIYGMVIGRTAGGLNRVIWNSGFLDLADLGLSQLLANATPGYYIEVTFNPQVSSNIRIVEAPANKANVLGRVISVSGIVTIGNNGNISDSLVTGSSASQANYHSLSGLTRQRNVMLMSHANATPTQFEKRTVYQQSYGTDSKFINPLRAQLTSTGDITNLMVSATAYDTTAYRWKIKEVYNQLLIAGTDAIAGSSWPTTVFASRIPTPDGTGTAPSFELQKVATSPEYSDPANIGLYKQFNVSKYYQYAAVAPGTSTYGKVVATLTVFDPEGVNKGGEVSKTLVWDFFDYDLNFGLEIKHRRAVITGAAAVSLYANELIIPASLRAL